ncbi:unnamed protein product [Toxocara canis]|uniref:Uncharacterized protein n=1 Tax=Toxocara canis TaxID=6265 RepID=A0A183UX81_TOXCA|nr:unnamed protein product [Toxocara canis]
MANDAATSGSVTTSMQKTIVDLKAPGWPAPSYTNMATYNSFVVAQPAQAPQEYIESKSVAGRIRPATHQLPSRHDQSSTIVAFVGDRSPSVNA